MSLCENAIAEHLDLQFAEMLPDGIIIYSIGDKAELLYANRVALEIFECSNLEDLQEFCKGDYLNVFHPEDFRHHKTTIRLAWANEHQFEHHAQYRVVTKSGKIKMLNDSGRVIPIPGYHKCFICVLSELDHQINYALEVADSLTGLLSLGQFIQYCENYLTTRENRANAHLYNIAYFNIRRFKEYNVEYGAQKGNFVLQALGRIIEKWSTTKVVARIGGDQFVAISRSQEMQDRIRNVIDEFSFEYGRYGMSVDVGVYPIQNSQQDIHKACDLAKAACDSIHNSRESVCIYNDTLSKKLKVSNYIIHHLDEAIENGYIQVYYQPVMRTMTGELCGMEALARWIDPEMGFLAPGDFISVLEDNHMITKLDLYMLEHICIDMKAAEAQGMILVPVSLNLSRMDFIDYDIFAEVERIVKKYNVPRDMINVEITESMVMGDADLFTREIARFRLGGYQVWMDDFGSGYSSLNILQDFRFDEIKLDMQFLANFCEKSKTIIESIIVMAKKLGVQTLAEGVETQEQFEFLRKVGCEKVQGYLFSRPLPNKDLTAHIESVDMLIEDRAWREYYNAIGKVNIITDRALSIVEFNGKNFEYLVVNDTYREVWKSLGVNDIETAYEVTNAAGTPLGRQIRELQRVLHPEDEPQTVTASVNGQYIRLNIRCIAEHASHAAYNVELVNLTSREDRDRRKLLDKVFRMMYSLYDSIYLLDLEAGTFQTLMHGTSSKVEDYRSFHKVREIDALAAGTVFIHPSDQKEYLEFCDLDTIVERLRATERGYIVHYFRTRTANGAYVWKAHTLLYIPSVNSIIYCSRAAYFEQPGLMEKVAPEYYIDTLHKANAGIYQSLRQGILGSKNLKLFLKDTERRFVWANDQFLQFYGLTDLAEIIGKTDDELGWLAEHDPFKDDEGKIIEHGVVIANQLGTCMVQGVPHTMIVSKEPVYEKAKIVGLLGAFLSVEGPTADETEEAEQERKLFAAVRQKELEKLLGTYDRQMHTLVDALEEALVGVVVYSVEDRKVLYQNHFAREIIEKYFEGDEVALQEAARPSAEREETFEEENEKRYEKILHGRFFQFRIRMRWWNGRKAKVVYVMDNTPTVREEKLLKLSETDGLSQLYNHVSGEHYVNEYLRGGVYGMFCLMDIDKFKAINDTYGHAVGDQVIQGISRCMKDTFRENDILIRVGGDEFAVYAPGLLEGTACSRRIQMLEDKIASMQFGNLPFSVSVSVGTVMCSEKQQFTEFDQLYKTADVLMYDEKQTKNDRENGLLPMEFSDEMPTALLIYRADDSEEILFASRRLIELFDCESKQEFLNYTKGSFAHLMHPDDAERVEREIREQIEASGEACVDHVFYRIISAKGRIKYIEDYGHLVDSKNYGHAYFVTLNEKAQEEHE